MVKAQTITAQTITAQTIKALRVDPRDNVAMVFSAASLGDVVDYGPETIPAAETVPAGHKMALSPIRTGGDIVKFGVTIGRALADIRVGEHVHCHNILDITEELCRMPH